MKKHIFNNDTNDKQKQNDNILFVLCFWDMPLVDLNKLHHFMQNYFLEKDDESEHLISIMSKRITKEKLKELISEQEYSNINHLFKDKLENRIPNPFILRKNKLLNK